MRYKIGIADPFRLGEKEFELERDMLKDYDVDFLKFNCLTEEDIINQMSECDICLVVSSPFTRRVIEALPKCKGILRYGIGLDNVDVAAATERKVQVCYEPAYCVEDVATHAFIMMLDLSKKISMLDKEVRAGNWGFSIGYPARRLQGKTIGLLGFGNIAQRLAELVQVFNMDIVTFDPFVSNETTSKKGIRKVEFEELLAVSDFISIHCPLTESTRHLLSTEQFSKMRPTAFVINTSRGPIIDTNALVQALEAGKICGAGLDVHENEPLNKEHPLCKMNNVILTPHAGFYTEEAFFRLRTSIIEQTIAILKSEKPAYIANPQVI